MTPQRNLRSSLKLRNYTFASEARIWDVNVTDENVIAESFCFDPEVVASGEPQFYQEISKHTCFFFRNNAGQSAYQTLGKHEEIGQKQC